MSTTYPYVCTPELLKQALEAPKKPTRPEKPISTPSSRPPVKTVEAPMPPWQRVGLGMAAGLAVVALPIVGPLELLAVLAIGGRTAWSATVGFDEAMAAYRQQVAQNTRDVAAWHAQELRRQQAEQADYQRQLRAYEQACADFAAKRDELTLQQVKRTFQQVQRHFVPNQPRENPWEQVLAERLRTALPQCQVYRHKGVPIPGYPHPYTPDIVVHDPSSGLWLDVEIDEPWYLQAGERVPYHILGDWHQERRDQFFVEHHWLVIRFAELQVANHLDACVGYVHQQLSRWRGGMPLKLNLPPTASVPPMPRWSQSDACQLMRPRLDQPTKLAVVS